MTWKTKPPIEKLCVGCGTKFMDATYNHRGKFCGVACRRRRDSRNAKEWRKKMSAKGLKP